MFTYKLYVKILNNELNDIYTKKLLTIKKSRDSGFDLFMPTTTQITYKDTKLIDTQIICKMVKIFTPSSTEYSSGGAIEQPSGFYLYPRSSIYKTPLLLHNSVGIIDSGYRGNIKAPLCNFKGDVDNAYIILKHTRLVQICAPDLSPFEIIIVDKLDATSRGSDGFGSTGI
tara:strand:+ start:12513 stop:13025 length:513 start_codon:yes stop_codon:yes gene_type:complete